MGIGFHWKHFAVRNVESDCKALPICTNVKIYDEKLTKLKFEPRWPLLSTLQKQRNITKSEEPRIFPKFVVRKWATAGSA